MSHTTSPHLQDSPDSSSQLLTVEVRGLQASAPLPQRRNTHENILQSIFLVNRSEPVLHQLDQPDENLSRFNMVEIFTSLHCHSVGWGSGPWHKSDETSQRCATYHRVPGRHSSPPSSSQVDPRRGRSLCWWTARAQGFGKPIVYKSVTFS